MLGLESVFQWLEVQTEMTVVDFVPTVSQLPNFLKTEHVPSCIICGQMISIIMEAASKRIPPFFQSKGEEFQNLEFPKQSWVVRRLKGWRKSSGFKLWAKHNIWIGEILILCKS